jgi:hypothetical protein
MNDKGAFTADALLQRRPVPHVLELMMVTEIRAVIRETGARIVSNNSPWRSADWRHGMHFFGHLAAAIAIHQPWCQNISKW